MTAAGAPRRALLAWCLYDWANSAFFAIVSTFLFATYFTQAVAPSVELGTAQWGQAMSLAAIAIAVASPVLGAIADQGGRRKPWLGALSLVGAVATAALWFVRPEAADVLFALVAAGIATFAFEIGAVFYNAMLPDLVRREWLGRLSGWAWGLGYAGGLVCLALCLLLFVQPDPPLFGLDPAAAEQIRATGPVVALWFALFALPLFLFTPDRPSTGIGPAAAVRQGLAALAATLGNLRRHANVARFLLAKMLYIDGLNTLFTFGGIYAAGSFGMAFDEVLLFGILLNVTSGLGAFGFGWVDDRIGAKRTILIALGALTLLGGTALLIESKSWFYVIGMGIGAFLGPVQSASRSLMARLAPADLRTEFFGLYALAGKATAFLGPALVGWVTLAFASQRAGMATILVFFVAGFLALLTVRERGA